MCDLANMAQKGLNALSAYKFRCQNPERNLPIMKINVYNAALKCLASEGNFTKMEDILKYMESLNVKLDIQSYVAIFECLGRCNVQNNHLREIRIWGKDVMWNGFTFDRILNEGVLLNDQREYVLSAMQAYDKDYIPKYTPPNVQYNNSLLDELNNEEQLEYKERNVEGLTGVFTKRKMKKMIEEQMKIEKNGYVTIKNIENTTEPTEEILKYRQAFDEHIKMWESVAVTAFNRDLSTLSANKQGHKLEPFMKSIPIKDFVSIMVEEAKVIAQGSETYSPTVNQLYRELGAKVYSRYKVLRKKKTGVLDKILRIHTKYCNDYVTCHHEFDVPSVQFKNQNSRQLWQCIEFKERGKGSSIELDHQPWVPTTLQGIGKFLYNIIMHDLKVDVSVMKGTKNKNYVSAFYTIFRHHGRIVKEEVKPHPTLSRLYRASVPETLKFPTFQVPMRCPPVPWSSLNIGGYLATHTEFVRLPPQAVTQKQRLQENSIEQLYPSFDSLNQLAAVPWKVNQRILECIMKVFTTGGSSKLSVPEHPSTLPPPIAPSTEMDKSQKYQFFRQKLQYRRKKGEMYSLWCDCLYRLSLANHFKGDVFWLPHNMDFRGRVYPVPPHLNHLGSDLARSMLVFAEGRPLGPKGLDWLKIHLINLTGLKKRDSIQERLEYANEIMDKILDSADNPLDGQMWWASSDEPWQTLACCMEIADASRSENHEKYISHFPVHQDGSCNGLQHYAALGRDSAGGYSVNLSPASKPQDVYSAVAVLVEERRHKDEENGIEIARILNGFVRRKVIKQTVMTTVYGVTRFGARLQIARQLKDIDDFPKEHVWAGSQYLTSRTFESLRSMFTSTREIQDWFTECARLISSICGENVEWVTPLGLPIVQPYFRYKSMSSNGFYEPFLMDKYE
ncbi:dna-directed rna polymerase mitochondrial [Holotrichia oblita]|uniref:Dna-directed rna polymerase mitochondrial n=1 Tax=Holotrichia oblita TaxID=644536 RepID=A0ACB9STF6_HOLOL|nr:dna-directed rna polymerase mitochondrial [Holotrichia oblita]